MDFDDTPEEAAFRAKARDWIDANAPKHLEAELKRARFGSSGVESQDPMAAAKAWQKTKAGAGWACLHWPKEYGGGAYSPIERVIWGQEEGIYGALSSPFIIGHGMCGPTVMAWATEDQKRELLPPAASGEQIWCQLFSERAFLLLPDHPLDRAGAPTAIFLRPVQAGPAGIGLLLLPGFRHIEDVSAF